MLNFHERTQKHEAMKAKNRYHGIHKNTARKSIIEALELLAATIWKIARRLYISAISKAIWINEAVVFEPQLHSFYKRLEASGELGKPATIVDVGANRGQAACFFNRLLPGARIVAIEANPDLVPLLKRKTLNLNIEVIPIAVSEKPGILPFYRCVFDEVSTLETPDKDSEYLLFKSKVLLVHIDEMYKAVDVDTTTLDQLISKLNLAKIDILKIDVEGHEASVLKGATLALAKKTARFIQIESHGDDQYQGKGAQAEAILALHGYRLIARIKHGFGNFHEEIYASK